MTLNKKQCDRTQAPNLPLKRNLELLKVCSRQKKHTLNSKPQVSQVVNNAKNYANWLSQLDTECLYALTLTFRNKICSDETVKSYLRQLNHKLRKSIYPKTALRLDKFNEAKHLSIFAVIEEHVDTALHIHAVLFKPPHNPKV